MNPFKIIYISVLILILAFVSYSLTVVPILVSEAMARYPDMDPKAAHYWAYGAITLEQDRKHGK
jgi:hypothetical protein